MKKYAEALGARLENRGIIFDSVSKEYLEKVACIDTEEEKEEESHE
jgi:hypothetical protein